MQTYKLELTSRQMLDVYFALGHAIQHYEKGLREDDRSFMKTAFKEWIERTDALQDVFTIPAPTK